jgi:hypothetical protein
VLYPPSGPSIHLVPSAVTPPHLEAHLGIQVPVAAAHGSARAARTVVPPTATATVRRRPCYKSPHLCSAATHSAVRCMCMCVAQLDGSLHTVSRQHGDHATDDAAPSADRLEPIVEHADAGGAIAASCGANADAMYGALAPTPSACTREDAMRPWVGSAAMHVVASLTSLCCRRLCARGRARARLLDERP